MVYYYVHWKEVIMERKYFKTKDNAQTSDVIDLPSSPRGVDFLMDYNDMVRTVRTKGIEYAKNHNPLAKKFSRFMKG